MLPYEGEDLRENHPIETTTTRNTHTLLTGLEGLPTFILGMAPFQ